MAWLPDQEGKKSSGYLALQQLEGNRTSLF